MFFSVVLLACMAVSVRLWFPASDIDAPMLTSLPPLLLRASQFGTQDWIEAGVIFALVVLNVSGQFLSSYSVHSLPR